MAFLAGDLVSVISSGLFQESIAGGVSVVSISPTSGNSGDVVSIVCTGAEANQGNGVALIGGKAVNITTWSDTAITGTVPYGLAAQSHTVIVLNNSGSSGSYSSFTITTPTSGLDRKGVCDMVRDCLRADTATLYGTSKLVQVISSDWTDFQTAGADTVKPYKLYLYCPPKNTADVRAQNADIEFAVNMRIEGYKIDPDTAASAIDDIDAQVELLINQQMYNGQMFTAYFTDSYAQVIDAEYQTGDLTIENTGDKMVVECAATILIKINRWR